MKAKSQINKSAGSKEFRDFISAIISIANEPQIFKQWIKEKRAWKHLVNSFENIRFRDTLKVKLKKKGEKKFTTVYTDK